MPDGRPKLTKIDQLFEDARQGSATIAPETASHIEAGAREVAGRGVNTATMALSGGQMGGLWGALGMGAIGAALPPSETPAADGLATAGEGIASLVTGGRSRLIKGLAQLAGGTSGVTAGAMIDRISRPDMVHQSPYGEIGIYFGTTALSLAAGGVMGNLLRPTSLAKNANEIASITGEEIPLSSGQRFGGLLGAAEDFIAPGSGAAIRLTKQQSDILTRATNKMLSVDVMNPVPKVEAAGKTRINLNKVVEDWRADNTTTVREATGMFDSRGNIIYRDVEKLPAKEEFGRALGMDKEETRLFFEAIGSDTQGFLDKIIGGNKETRLRGLIAFRGVIKAAEASGDSELTTTLSSGLISRILKENGAFNCQIACGTQFYSALMEKFGRDKLRLALGSTERADAIETLATVIRDIDPARQLSKLENATSPITRNMSYGGNKILFSIGSMVGGAATGSKIGGMLGSQITGMLIGAGAGLVIGIPVHHLTSKVLHDPKFAKFLQRAAETGDPLLISRVVRTLTISEPEQKTEQQAIEPSSTPRSRMEQLFQQNVR